ncbi:hypothetical protein D3C72_1558230 [compost metagenome]
MVHRARQAPGRQLAVGQVGTIGKGLEHQRHVGGVGQLQLAAVVRQGQDHQRQALAVAGAGVEHRGKQRVVTHEVVVQGAMGLHIGDLGADGAAEGFQRADLVEHQGAHLLCRAGHVAAAESGEVRIGRMGADAHVVAHRQFDGALHGQRVGGMEPAGEVRLVHQRHGVLVVAHFPGTEAFPHVAVQQDWSVHVADYGQKPPSL